MAFVGSLLLAMLFIADWLLPMGPTQSVTSGEANKPTIRIKSADHKWPERIAFDTSAPTIVAQMPPLVADAPVTNTQREAFALLGAPMNSLFNVPTFPTADMRQVVRPNFDTLYSFGYLDLTKEPMVVSVPDTGGRYYLLPMLDMGSDVFASPGWRTTGTQAANFLVTPRGWSGAVPSVLTQIEAPTPYVWIIGRTKTDGPSDYDAVHKIQAGYKVTPLSQWGISPRPIEGKLDPGVDMKTPPKTQVDTMPADKYFAYSAELLRIDPPHITDQPIVAQMKRIGIEPGKSFDISNADPVTRNALEEAPAA